MSVDNSMKLHPAAATKDRIRRDFPTPAGPYRIIPLGGWKKFCSIGVAVAVAGEEEETVVEFVAAVVEYR